MLGEAQAAALSSCARVNVVWCVFGGLVKVFEAKKVNQKMLGWLMTVEGKRIKPVKIVRTLKIDINGQLIKNQIL